MKIKTRSSPAQRAGNWIADLCDQHPVIVLVVIGIALAVVNTIEQAAP